jgi:hypothetical protein
MKGSPANHHETENVTTMFDSDRMNDVLITHRVAKHTTNLRIAETGDVTCEALHLALNALQIDKAWHAGVISAQAAMEDLHREIGKTINRCDQSARTGLR